jgi:hypothetical protein
MVALLCFLLSLFAAPFKSKVAFFFEGVPDQAKAGHATSPDYVSEFVATSDGLALMEAFTKIKDSKVRRHIVGLVEEIASDDE